MTSSTIHGYPNHIKMPRSRKRLRGSKHARKLGAGRLVSALSSRLFHPRHAYQTLRKCSQPRKRGVKDDSQLALYARIFPTGFLHYGYFEDPELQAEEISLADVERAQAAYTQLQVDLAGDPSLPVLDIGCGMGGIARVLAEAGYETTALTPDRVQAAHIESTMAHIPVVRTKF